MAGADTAVGVQIPPQAIHEWRALSDALLDRRPPCQTAQRPEAWQPRRTKVDPTARAACASCPTAGACLEYALAAAEPEGLWGGLTALERHELAVHLRVAVKVTPDRRHGDESRYADGCRCTGCSHAHQQRVRSWLAAATVGPHAALRV